MQKLLAKPVVEAIERSVRERAEAVRKRRGHAPKLAVIIVGEDPGSQIYVRKKGETAVAWGLESETVKFPATVSIDEVRAAVQRLNKDPKIDGILIQRPLPKSFNEEEVAYWVAPEKDVDAFHPENTGRLVLGLPCFKPCTPAGVMAILSHYGISPKGKTACVIGRSTIVGKPMASLLLQADATVYQTHSRTPDLPGVARQADILVAAVGRAKMVDASYVKEGAVIIDVGINRTPEGKVVGDVDFDSAATRASAITPVPGGVGPMTIAILLENTVWSAERR